MGELWAPMTDIFGTAQQQCRMNYMSSERIYRYTIYKHLGIIHENNGAINISVLAETGDLNSHNVLASLFEV